MRSQVIEELEMALVEYESVHGKVTPVVAKGLNCGNTCSNACEGTCSDECKGMCKTSSPYRSR